MALRLAKEFADQQYTIGRARVAAAKAYREAVVEAVDVDRAQKSARLARKRKEWGRTLSIGRNEGTSSAESTTRT